MTQAKDIMTVAVRAVAPGDSLRRAAQLMRELDVGALPVADGQRLVGMVTDRDITVRGVAEGLSPGQCRVADVMTTVLQQCAPDDAVEDVMLRMGAHQLRRLPVVDGVRLVGIVSLADLARRQHADIDRVVREVSEPGAAFR